MLDMALKNIWQRKARSILTVMGVGMSVLLYVYMSTIMSFYDADLQRTVSGFAGKVVVQARTETLSRFPATDSVIPTAEAESILQRSEVDPERSSAVLFETLVANTAPSMPPSVMAVGITPGRESAYVGNAGAAAGTVTLGGPDEVILGAKAAEHYATQTGDSLRIRGRQFRVAGVLDKANELLDGSVIMPLETARALFIRPGVASAVLLTAQQTDMAAELAAAIAAEHPGLDAASPAEMAKNANEILTAQRKFFGMIEGMIMSVSLIVITIVMVMAVAERRKELGTLKALGTSAFRILSLVVAEAVTLSLAGGVLAVAAAWWLTRNESMGVDASQALHAIGVAALVGAVAALWPAWTAQRVDPVESLRYE